MTEQENKDKPKVQAENNSIAVGGINVGGDVSGNITIGNTGYTSDEVSVLITQIKSTFQPKQFDGRSPYKGLDVFEEEDAELFFGREKLVDDLVGRVKESRTVFITGPSGSGKSSLVRAGLIPALKQGAIKNSERWLYATMKPGRDPISELGRVASGLAGSANAEDEIRAKATDDATIFARWCEIALKEGRDKRVVLFIDQFEEVFTQISNEAERVTFLNLLTHAATVENGCVIILFSMRSDFVSNCATYPQLNAVVNQQFVQIGAMQPEELVSAIAQPALRVGLPIDPDLVAQIIKEMKGEPGALPLMQFALKDLFDSQQEKSGVIALTLNDYLQRGGIHKALERHADDSFSKLSMDEQELARSIFSGLIEIGRGTEDTRRTALFDELIPANAKAKEVKDIVQRLADARLITTDERAGKDTVTISHEKLIDAWPWLKKLVNENRDVIALQNEINSDAKEWEEHKRDAGYLYIGARLLNADEQVKKQNLNLNQLAREFVKASQARKRRSQGLIFSGISIILIVSIIAAVLFRNQAQAAKTAKAEAEYQREIAQANAEEAQIQAEIAQANAEEAQRQAEIALARQLASQAQLLNTDNYANQMIASLLSVQSMKLFPTDGATRFLINDNNAALPITHMSYNGDVSSANFSPDGKYVVSGGCSELDTTHGVCITGVARVWEVATGLEVAHRNHVGQVTSVAFSSDGKHVVSHSEDGIPYIWEAATGLEVARLIHDDNVNSVSFSPDGKYIVSSSWDNTVRVWDATTGVEVARMTHDDNVNSVSFSPDGKYIVSSSWDNTARVWDATTGVEVARMTHDDNVNSVSFSPDGKYIVSSSRDNTVRVWDATTGVEVARMTHDGSVESIAFSPNGKYIVSSSWDNTARVWDATTGLEVARMTHDDYVSSVSFSPDGKYIVSSSWDNTVRVWDATTGVEVARMTHNDNVNSVSFSPDGKYIVSSSWDNTARVWETTKGVEITHITHNDSVTSVSFSPDGKYLVWGGCDKRDSTGSMCIAGSAHISEVITGLEVAHISHDNTITSVAFSPDGEYIVSSSYDNTVSIWEAATGVEVNQITHNDFVNSVAFSPDGNYIVWGGCDIRDSSGDVCVAGSARISEVITGLEVVHINHVGPVTSANFSPDGKYVVSSSFVGAILIWEVATGVEVASLTNDNFVTSVAFSPDGKLVVSASQEKTVYVWEATTGLEVASMTHDDSVESVVFSPDGRYIASASHDNTTRIWEAATGIEVARMSHEGPVTSVAFSPDGKYIISGNADGTVHIWIWQAQDLIKDACAHLPRNLTSGEWEQYIGDVLPYPKKQEDATCPNLPIETEEIVTPTP